MNNSVTVKWVGIIVAIILAFSSIIFTSLNTSRVKELATQLKKIEANEERIDTCADRIYRLEAADKVLETNMLFIKEQLADIKEMLRE